jgi:hypothetical protein
LPDSVLAQAQAPVAVGGATAEALTEGTAGDHSGGAMTDDLASISRRLAALNEELSAVSTGLQRLLGVSEAPPPANPTPRPGRRDNGAATVAATAARTARTAENDERVLQAISETPLSISELAKSLPASRATTLARLNRLATAGRATKNEDGKWTTPPAAT